MFQVNPQAPLFQRQDNLGIGAKFLIIWEWFIASEIVCQLKFWISYIELRPCA